MKLLFIISFVFFAISFEAQNLEQNKIRYNGTYSLYSNDTVNWKAEALWSHLKPFEGFSSQDRTGDLFVTIDILNEKQISFILQRNDSIMSKKVLMYKMKGDSSLIIRKRKNQVNSGIPFVYYLSREERLTFSVNKANNLILDYDGGSGAMVFILAFGVPIKGVKEFTRVK